MNDLQNCILDIFKEFASICERHKIDYFAIGGTCIGAVRHGGFIPWDDDLDVAVPIEQYDKCLNAMKSELPDYLKVFTGLEHETYRYVFAKIIDTRTTFIEDAELGHPKDYKGVYIDIMPMSGIPRGEKEKIQFYKSQQYNLRMNEKIRVDHEVDSFKGRMGVVMASCIKKVFGYNYYFNKWFAIMRKNPMFLSPNTGYTWSLFHRNDAEKFIYAASWFKETTLLPFEDTCIRCPKGYHSYLTKQFGDYMKLPPDEDRLGHHYGIVDLEKSYTEYQKSPSLVQKYLTECEFQSGGN